MQIVNRSPRWSSSAEGSSQNLADWIVTFIGFVKILGIYSTLRNTMALFFNRVMWRRYYEKNNINATSEVPLRTKGQNLD